MDFVVLEGVSMFSCSAFITIIVTICYGAVKTGCFCRPPVTVLFLLTCK